MGGSGKASGGGFERRKEDGAGGRRRGAPRAAGRWSIRLGLLSCLRNLRGTGEARGYEDGVRRRRREGRRKREDVRH